MLVTQQPQDAGLVIEQEGPVAILTIDRPGRRNAIGAALVERLFESFDRAARDSDTRAIVLTGVAPGFCAGSDLKELADTDLAGMQAHEGRTAALARSIALLDKPVVAGIEGFALGGGFLLALSCDIVVTTPATRWHLPEVTIGWIPPWGLQALVARIGPVAARRMAWGAEPFDGTEAHRLGVADYLTEPGETVRDAALRCAQRLAALPAAAVTSTKQFFAPLVAGAGESLDAVANRLFLGDCAHPTAKATLARFGVRP
jgi:enoyl-CoA hydratase/carnithine racemase